MQLPTTTVALALLTALLTPCERAADTSATVCSAADVQWLWSGALSSHSVTFKLGLREGHGCSANAFVLHAHPELQPSERPHSAIALCRPTNAPTVHVCELAETLYADRAYTYELQSANDDDTVVARTGSFRTPMDEGSAMSFRVAFSSCADEDSDPRVFDEIAAHDPLLFLHMGDLHYHNLEVNDIMAFRSAYHSLFASPSGQAMLAMDKPFAYMWDDHDFGPDNSDKTAPGRDAAAQAYREFVPHYALADTDPLAAVHQSFTIGRVRFLLTDLRSERTPNLAPSAPSKSVLGVKQKQWFKNELLNATDDPNVALIVWVSTMPWLDDERKWGHFTHEQRELVTFCQGHVLNTRVPIVIASGDAHMLAVDDGTNSPGNFVTLHAAALGRPGSVKGGPYSHGAIPGSGQYGLLDFTDDGVRVCVRYSGRRVGKGELLAFDTCYPERTPPQTPYVPLPVPLRKLVRVSRKVLKHVRAYAVAYAVAVAGIVVAIWIRRQRATPRRSVKRD